MAVVAEERKYEFFRNRVFYRPNQPSRLSAREYHLFNARFLKDFNKCRQDI